KSPMGPAPKTETVSPNFKPDSLIACTATAVGSINAASCRVIFSGSLITCFASTVTKSAKPPSSLIPTKPNPLYISNKGSDSLPLMINGLISSRYRIFRFLTFSPFCQQHRKIHYPMYVVLGLPLKDRFYQQVSCSDLSYIHVNHSHKCQPTLLLSSHDRQSLQECLFLLLEHLLMHAILQLSYYLLQQLKIALPIVNTLYGKKTNSNHMAWHPKFSTWDIILVPSTFLTSYLWLWRPFFRIVSIRLHLVRDPQ